MENNIKQHVLTFEKGLTHTPSDLMCDDNTLEVCEGVTMVDGEWKAVQSPRQKLSGQYMGELLAVHKGDNYSHYIYLDKKSQSRALIPSNDGIKRFTTPVIVTITYSIDDATKNVTFTADQQLKTDVEIKYAFVRGGQRYEQTTVFNKYKTTHSMGGYPDITSFEIIGLVDKKIEGFYYRIYPEGNAPEMETNLVTYQADYILEQVEIELDNHCTDDLYITCFVTLFNGQKELKVVKIDAGTDKKVFGIRGVMDLDLTDATPNDDLYIYEYQQLNSIYPEDWTWDKKENYDTPTEIKDELYYIEENDATYTPKPITSGSASYIVKSVKTVGNTLVVIADNGIYYYLWKYSKEFETGAYVYLGDKIPCPNIKFKMGQQLAKITTANGIGIITAESGALAIVSEDGKPKKDDYNNLVGGLYAESVNELHKWHSFCNPFFVRYAIRLYDQTYTYASAPVMMLPSVHRSSYFSLLNASDKSKIQMQCTTYASELLYNIKESVLDDWRDIVDNITVFVTREVPTLNITKDATVDRLLVGSEDDGVLKDGVHIPSGGGMEIMAQRDRGAVYCVHTEQSGTFYKGFTRRSYTDIVDDMIQSSVFFKLCDIGIYATNTIDNGAYKNAWYTTKAHMKETTLGSLEGQETLTGGDYYSRCGITAEGAETFNRRLNLWGVSRGFYEGYTHFSGLSTSDDIDTKFSQNANTYIIATTITTSSGLKTVVAKEYDSHEMFYSGMWFYYPDPRATSATVYKIDKTTSKVYKLFDIILKEHPRLNGACSILTVLPDSSTVVPVGELASGYPTASNEPEKLGNYILQSDVDNPFVFNAKSYVRIGQGEILGLAGLTTALSQDAYKVATTLAFTTQGIWAINTDGTGQYANIQPPFSREVCNNAKSITMTDNAVFFTSEKGLMCVTGTGESNVVCVSEKLRGNNEREFFDFLKDCGIAYDYKTSLLYVYQADKDKCWVYNIKNGIWSKAEIFGGDGAAWLKAVNNYPDTILQDNEYNCYSLFETPQREDDVMSYWMVMVSRPLKFEGSLILKSIRQVRKLFSYTKTEDGVSGDIDISLFAKNGVKEEWTELESVKGKAWRFFKICLSGSVSAKDSLLGVAVVTQVKYNDKIR